MIQIEKLKKLNFFLPTEEQWQEAAKHLNSIQNKKGCYLLNGQSKDDGGFAMVKVDSYFENENKLYCAYGNVNEMICNASYSKGGSWNTEHNEINLKGKYQNGPHPTVGFRVFSKIIEK